MDAREYLARKGLDGERDKERPNTLEEKAWYRARESGDHRPRAGTPHDWEDWERYHETLAEGADALEQKIDHEAHQRALDHEQASEEGEADEATRSGSGVEHFTPPASAPVETASATAHEAESRATPESRRSASESTRPEPFAAMVILAVLMPPLAMALAGAGGRRVILSLVLMLLGWVPGAAYAVFWLLKH